MIKSEIAKILRSTIGLKISSVGTARLEQAVARRIRLLGLPGQEEYTRVLNSSPKEKSQLIEEVVIPETWFFRDGDPFVALEKHVRDNWLAFAESGLRILSIPCATGEEPYSIAMSLLDAGFPPASLRIDAVDISDRALDAARRGLFGRKSFRGENLSFRDHHFRPAGEREYAISDAVRARVRFSKGNILSLSFSQQFAGYHIIFCKNVLIYLSRQSRGIAIRNLGASLAEDGLIFTSPAETALFTANGFSHANSQRGYILIKPEKPRQERIAEEAKALAEEPEAVATPPTTPLAGRRMNEESLPATGADLAAQLAKAKKLADSGRIDEASRILTAISEKHPPTAEFCYLFGLILDVQGDFEKASAMLRKAIYLDPRHVDAITVLAYLSRRLGDEKGYTACMQRLEMLEEEGLTGGVDRE